MSRALKVELSEEENATLRMWAGLGKNHERLALRARVILLAAQGLSLARISAEVSLSWQNCLKWRKRFLESGLDGLYDNKRCGAPRSISAEERERLKALAGSGPGRRSLRQLSEASGHSISTVWRILGENSPDPPKPALGRGRGLAPEFAEKQAGVLGLYLSRREHALVIGVYEKAGSDAGGPRPLTSRPLAGGRNWRASLLTALAAHDGSGEGEGGESPNFLNFLKRVYRRFPGREVHVIADDPAGPGQALAAPWAAARRGFTVHYMPPRAFWLIHMEMCFRMFARELPEEGPWASKEEMTERIVSLVKAFPDSWSRPFRWTCE